MDLACCHGNRYDVISALKVLPNNRVVKIFIVFLHYEISFFGIFHRFTNTIALEKPFRASLSTHVFERRTATGREIFACQGSGVSQIFILIISNGEKILAI